METQFRCRIHLGFSASQMSIHRSLSPCHSENCKPRLNSFDRSTSTTFLLLPWTQAIQSLFLYLLEPAHISSNIAECSESGNVLVPESLPRSGFVQDPIYGVCPRMPQASRLSTTQASIFLDTTLRINASKLVRMKGACLFVSGVAA